jgi:hypothetical protein
VDDAKGEEGNDLDSLDEEFVQPHLELEGDVDDAIQKVLFYCSALSWSSHP